MPPFTGISDSFHSLRPYVLALATLGHTTVVMTGRYGRRRLRADHGPILGNLLGGPTESPAVETAVVS